MKDLERGKGRAVLSEGEGGLVGGVGPTETTAKKIWASSNTIPSTDCRLWYICILYSTTLAEGPKK